ncbi:MAG TPA: hypothetical protein VGI39_05340 [Polyangiaceae bacterium]|jgi:hypothetical protein
MAETTLRLTAEEAKGLVAVAKKIPSKGRRAEVQVRDLAGQLKKGEAIVFVVVEGKVMAGRTAIGAATVPQALRALLLGADVAAERLTTTASPSPPQLAAAEAALLDEAGLVEAPDGNDPLERARIELELLLRESPSLEEAAHELKVSTGRLRQRLGGGTLYGIKVGRAWRIPRFQFAKKGRLVRNIEKVLPAVRPEAHPLSVVTWATSPHQDLVVGKHEKPVTPLAWLEAGLDPETVVKLASEV